MVGVGSRIDAQTLAPLGAECSSVVGLGTCRADVGQLEGFTLQDAPPDSGGNHSQRQSFPWGPSVRCTMGIGTRSGVATVPQGKYTTHIVTQVVTGDRQLVKGILPSIGMHWEHRITWWAHQSHHFLLPH